MTVYGWDASDFDWPRGPMDLNAAYRDGIRFFTHKATEGTRVVHAHYGEAMNRARAAGFEFVGAYVVPRTPGNNGHGSIQAQVDYFLRYLDAHTPWWRTFPGFMLQVDTEKWGYDNVGPDVGAAMCAELAKRAGTFRVHYAPNWAYGNSIPGPDPLWASAYGTNPAVHYLEAYRRGGGDGHAGWQGYSGRVPTILQFGSKTRIGSQPTCDANAFRGSIEAFRVMVTGGKTMAFLDDEHAANMAFRMDGIAHMAAAVRGGPRKDEPLEIVQVLNRIDGNAAKAANAAPAAMSDAQFAELKAAYLEKVPTADDIVNAMLSRVPRI